MEYKLINMDVQSSIATIIFNRPEKRNAMSDDMRSEFIHALERISVDKGIRALLKNCSQSRAGKRGHCLS